MAQRHANTLARRQAIELLYQLDIIDDGSVDEILAQLHPVDQVTPAPYAVRLVQGTLDHLSQIDPRIARFAENWSVDRMPIVDRAILRLACYEMFFVDEIPVSVAINEAVDLARDFGGEDESPRFINGVLGRIAEDGGLNPESEQ